MKKRILLWLLCAAILLALPSCAKERHELLYSVTVGELTFDVRGSGTRAKQIVVKSDDEILWQKSIKVDKSVGSRDGDYGFVATDLNFDGQTDWMIARDVSGECISYLCYLQNAEGDGFTHSEELSALYNVKADPSKRVLLAFSHTTEDISKQEYIITDTATQYVWKDGALTPERCISLKYYSETKSYCLSAKIYNAETKRFDLDIEGFSDKWFFTEESIKAYDLNELYYFR